MPDVQDGFEIELFCPFVTGDSVQIHALPCTLLILFSFKTCFHYKYAKNPFNTLTDVCFSALTFKTDDFHQQLYFHNCLHPSMQ
jgi:hypothetical protein